MNRRESSPPVVSPDLGKFHDKNRVATGCRTALLDIWLIIGSFGMALLGVVTLSLIASAMGKDPEQYRSTSNLVRFTIDHRGWFVALCVAPALLGLITLRGHFKPRVAWSLRAIGTLLLGAMMLLIFMAFLALVQPLYQYQPL